MGRSGDDRVVESLAFWPSPWFQFYFYSLSPNLLSTRELAFSSRFFADPDLSVGILREDQFGDFYSGVGVGDPDGLGF